MNVMDGTSLTIRGVYQLTITPELFQAQRLMYAEEAQCWDHFSSVVLIEAVVPEAEGEFSLDRVTQENPRYPHGAPQAADDEGLLSLDGETLLARHIGCVKGQGPLRFAFYLHYWDPDLPLHWNGGTVVCPPPQPMPKRLQALMPYRPCD